MRRAYGAPYDLLAGALGAPGLPTEPHLTDEQIRDAWRAIAAATHPDRPDGGDLARYTQYPPRSARSATPGPDPRRTRM